MKIETGFTRTVLPGPGGKAHMEIVLTPPPAPEKTKPLAVALALDRSHDMNDPDRCFTYIDEPATRIQQVRWGAYSLVGMMKEKNLFGCVLFNHTSDICHPMVHPASLRIPDIKLQISRIKARGGRDLSHGLAEAGLMLARESTEDYHRVILAVVGGTSFGLPGCLEDYKNQCRRLKERGISVSLLGCGKYDVEIYRELAEWGGGKLRHVDDLAMLPVYFRNELQRRLAVGAQDVRLVIRTTGSLKLGENLSGLPQTTRRNETEIRFGDMAGPGSVCLELTAGKSARNHVELEIDVTYKSPEGASEKRMLFQTLGVKKDGSAVFSFDSRILAAWMEAWTISTLREMALLWDRIKTITMGKTLARTLEEMEAFAALYPGSEGLVETARKLLQEKSRPMVENRLGIGETRMLYLELCENLREREGKFRELK